MMPRILPPIVHRDRLSRFGPPVYGQPIIGQPVYASGQPVYGQPVYGQPIYGHPIYGQPIDGRSMGRQSLSRPSTARQESVCRQQLSDRLQSINRQPSEASPQPAFWLWSRDSEAHACRDERQFKKLTKFLSVAFFFKYLNVSATNETEEIQVQGVGTIELPIKTLSSDSTKLSESVLHLVDVLWVPKLPFNVIAAAPETDEWSNPTAHSLVYDQDGNLAASFQPVRKSAAGVPWNPRNASVLDPPEPTYFPAGHKIALSDHPSYSTNNPKIAWPTCERRKWQMWKAIRRDCPVPTRLPAQLPNEISTDPLQQGTKRGRPTNDTGVPDYILPPPKKMRSNAPSFTWPPPSAIYNPEIGQKKNGPQLDKDGKQTEEDRMTAAMSRLYDMPKYDSNSSFSSHELEWVNKHWGDVNNFIKGLRLNPIFRADRQKALNILRSCTTLREDTESTVTTASKSPVEKNPRISPTGRVLRKRISLLDVIKVSERLDAEGSPADSGIIRSHAKRVREDSARETHEPVAEEERASGSDESTTETMETVSKSLHSQQRKLEGLKDVISQTCAEMRRMHSASRSVVEAETTGPDNSQSNRLRTLNR